MKPAKRDSAAKAASYGRGPSGGNITRVERSVKRPEPSHSLYSTSTESSDQVQSAHNDLDRCARVLSEILDNDRGILDAIKKKARRCVGTRSTVTSKTPCKNKGNSRTKRGRNREPALGVLSSTPQKKPPLVPAASAGHPSPTAYVSTTSAQASCGSGRSRPHSSPETPPSAPLSCLAEGNAENRPGLGAASMSALDSPARRIKLMRRNVAWREKLGEPPHAVVAVGAAGTAGAFFDVPPDGFPLPPSVEPRSEGKRKARRQPAATSVSAERWHNRRAADSSCSSSSGRASASEADTLRGVHLENSSEFGVPPAFSMGAAHLTESQEGDFLGSLAAERHRQSRSARHCAERSAPSSAIAQPATVPNSQMGWEHDRLCRVPATIDRSLRHCEVPFNATQTGTSSATITTAVAADPAADNIAAARPDAIRTGSTQQLRRTADASTAVLRRTEALQELPDAISHDSDDSKDETLVTSVLEAAGCSPLDGVPQQSSPATEACRFRLRYLAREICMATKNSDLRDLAAELEKTVDVLLQERTRFGDQDGPPSALFAENMVLQKKLKLFEARLASAKATACDQADMKCGAYELQVAKLEGLIVQLERTIVEERRLLQQAADRAHEQQKLVEDLQSERARMIHALAFKDQLCAKLRRQQEAVEAQCASRIGELERGLGTLKSRLLDCTDELRESRTAIERLMNCTKVSYELLSRVTESVDTMTIDDALRKSLQVRLADVRCHLIRGCSDEFLLSADSMRKSASNERPIDGRVRFYPGEITAIRLSTQPTSGLDAALSQLGNDASEMQSSSSSNEARVKNGTECSGGLLGRPLQRPAPSAASTAYQPAGLPSLTARQPLPSAGLLAAASQFSRHDVAVHVNPSSERTGNTPAGAGSSWYSRTEIGSANAEIPLSSDLSTTRYSVTDYFRKYRPLLLDDDTCTSPLARSVLPLLSTSPPHNDINEIAPTRSTTSVLHILPNAEDVPRETIGGVGLRATGAAAAPEVDVPANRQDCSSPRLELSEIPCEPDEAGGSGMPRSSHVPSLAGAAAASGWLQRSQSQSFAGTALDTSQSTIANDEESVISIAPSTTTSVADSAFKQGLELLDADIARLQAQLRSSLQK